MEIFDHSKMSYLDLLLSAICMQQNFLVSHCDVFPTNDLVVDFIFLFRDPDSNCFQKYCYPRDGNSIKSSFDRNLTFRILNVHNGRCTRAFPGQSNYPNNNHPSPPKSNRTGLVARFQVAAAVHVPLFI